MFCDRCGASLAMNQPFCGQCGKPVGAVIPAAPAGSRVTRHRRVLGVLWIVFSALRLVPALGMLVFSTLTGVGSAFLLGGHLGPVLAPFISAIGGVIFALAVAGIIAGWGVLDRQPWARTLMLVVGVISLLDIPFGTALGIYTLWVLLPAPSEAEYRATAKSA